MSATKDSSRDSSRDSSQRTPLVRRARSAQPDPPPKLSLKPLKKRSTATAATGTAARPSLQIQADQARVAALYHTRISHADIAKKVGLSVSQVRYHLAQLRDEWLRRATWDFGRVQAEELARIDNLEASYWAAYKRSQADAVATDEYDEANNPRTVTKKKRRDGEAEFLRGVQWCIEQRCKMLGLHAPKEMIVEERRMAGKPVEAMSISELQSELARKGSGAVDEAEWEELKLLEQEEAALKCPSQPHP